MLESSSGSNPLVLLVFIPKTGQSTSNVSIFWGVKWGKKGHSKWSAVWLMIMLSFPECDSNEIFWTWTFLSTNILLIKIEKFNLLPALSAIAYIAIIKSLVNSKIPSVWHWADAALHRVSRPSAAAGCTASVGNSSGFSNITFRMETGSPSHLLNWDVLCHSICIRNPSTSERQSVFHFNIFLGKYSLLFRKWFSPNSRSAEHKQRRLMTNAFLASVSSLSISSRFLERFCDYFWICPNSNLMTISANSLRKVLMKIIHVALCWFRK